MVHIIYLNNGDRLALLKLVNIEERKAMQGSKVTVGKLEMWHRLQSILKIQGVTSVDHNIDTTV